MTRTGEIDMNSLAMPFSKAGVSRFKIHLLRPLYAFMAAVLGIVERRHIRRFEARGILRLQ